MMMGCAMKVRRAKKPTYTKCPNVFLDYWMPRLGHAELKVLLAITRKTFGWGKELEGDPISYSQLMRATGLSKKPIIKAIESLEERQLIRKIKSKAENQSNETNVYEIWFDDDDEDEEEEGEGGSGVSTLGGSGASTLGGSGVSIPTKERPLTKETTTAGASRS